MARVAWCKSPCHSRKTSSGAHVGAPLASSPVALRLKTPAATGQACLRGTHRLAGICIGIRIPDANKPSPEHAQMDATKPSPPRWADASHYLTSINDLPARYKGVLLDQYGTMHDGVSPYTGAIEAVRCLADGGLRILLLSNSSRRSAGALDKVAALGFDRDWFVGVVTSGEVAHQHLAERPTAFWQNLGRRVLHFTWSSRGQVVLDDELGLEVTEHPAEADFILAHGTEAVSSVDGSNSAKPKSVQQLEELLRQAAGAGRPPMIVANPDIVTTSGESLVTMPGALGRFYSTLGGKVHLMGKPDPVIYDAAAKLLDLQPSECIAIGDSLEHDIAGAAAASIDTVFVGGGIHAAELGIERDGRLATPSQTLKQLCQTGGLAPPTYATTFLQL